MAHKLRRITSITAPPKDDIFRKSDRRIRKVENIDIDYTVFEKTPAERERLRLAKLNESIIPKKKTRGGWAWRMRRRLAKEGLSYVEIEREIARSQAERNEKNGLK